MDAVLRSVHAAEGFARSEGPATPGIAAQAPDSAPAPHVPLFPTAGPDPFGVEPHAAPVVSQAPPLRPPRANAPRKSRRLGALLAGVASLVVVLWLVGLVGKQAGPADPAPSASAPSPAPLPAPAPMAARAPNAQSPADPAPADPPPADSAPARPADEAVPSSGPSGSMAPQRPAEPAGQSGPASRPGQLAQAAPTQVAPAPVAPVQAAPGPGAPTPSAPAPSAPAPSAPADPREAAPRVESGASSLEIQRRLRELDAALAVERQQATQAAAAPPVAQPTTADRESQAASRPETPRPAPPPTRAPPAPAPAPAPAPVDVSVLLREASPFERMSIEMACADQQARGNAGRYEPCVRQQLASLAASPGRPDLLQASRIDQIAVEEACAPDKRANGPARYYQCLRAQLALRGYGDRAAEAPRPAPTPVRQEPPPARQAPARPPARPSSETILASASPFERTSIERACAQERTGQDPTNFDSCLRWQMVNLSRSGGRPDLSGATAAEALVIENACTVQKNQAGPAQYYACLRGEMSRLGVR